MAEAFARIASFFTSHKFNNAVCFYSELADSDMMNCCVLIVIAFELFIPCLKLKLESTSSTLFHPIPRVIVCLKIYLLPHYVKSFKFAHELNGGKEQQ